MTSPAKITKCTYLAFTALILIWTLVWWLKAGLLDAEFTWLTTSLGGFIFWTIAKIFIWILPALWLIKLSDRTLKEVFNFTNWKKWLVWGGGAGVLIALTGWIPNFLGGNPVFPTEWSISLFSILFIAPVFEEFLMRGAILGNLLKSYSMFKANIITSLMFICLHIPGWYFMGTLVENLTKPLGGVFSIFLLSLTFGYVVYRSRSVLAGILAHFFNNFAS